MPEVSEIKALEKEIISEEGEIKDLEHQIEEKEEKILKYQNRAFRQIGIIKSLVSGISKYEAKFIHSRFLKRLSKHKILYSFTTLISIILIWTGFQKFLNGIPLVSNPIISIILGIFVVWFIDEELT